MKHTTKHTYYFGFQFLSTMTVGFGFSVQCTQYGFSGFAKEVTPCGCAKTVIPRDNLHIAVYPFEGMDDKPSSLFSSCYFNCIGCQAD